MTPQPTRTRSSCQPWPASTSTSAQFIIATHSPILMRAESATIYQLDDNGTDLVEYDNATAVGLWRRFLDHPDNLLDILYSDDE